MTVQYAPGDRPLPGRQGLPTTERPSGPPNRGRAATELRAPLQVARLLLRAPHLARQPRGDGAPVVDMPGWRTSEHAMAPLRAYLRWLGHDAHGWGLGVNRGDPVGDAKRMIPRVARRAEQAGRPVALVGWSLGGVVAREVARVLVDEVSQVITLASPIQGGPVYTVAGGSYDAAATEAILSRIAHVERTRPIAQPITAIWTRRDAVVAWRACLDHHSPDVVHVEVGSTHLSLGVDPDVWEIVARRLGGTT